MLPTSRKPTGHQRIRRATLRSAAKLLRVDPTSQHTTSRTIGPHKVEHTHQWEGWSTTGGPHCRLCGTPLYAYTVQYTDIDTDHTHDWTGEDTTPGAHCATCGLTYLGTSGGTPIYTHPNISPLQGATFQPIGTHLPP